MATNKDMPEHKCNLEWCPCEPQLVDADPIENTEVVSKGTEHSLGMDYVVERYTRQSGEKGVMITLTNEYDIAIPKENLY